MNDNRLMPCGCGGDAVYYDMPDEEDMGRVECLRCSVSTAAMFPESAIDVWNTAMGGEEVRKQIEALIGDGVTLSQVVDELAYRDEASDENRWDDNLFQYSTEELETIDGMWEYYFPSKRQPAEISPETESEQGTATQVENKTMRGYWYWHYLGPGTDLGNWSCSKCSHPLSQKPLDRRKIDPYPFESPYCFSCGSHNTLPGDEDQWKDKHE